MPETPEFAASLLRLKPIALLKNDTNFSTEVSVGFNPSPTFATGTGF